MKRLGFGILLLLLGKVSAFAGDTISHPELAMAYLGQVFGSVPGVGLSGVDDGLAGHIFRFFNQGIMVVAAVWLMYSITQVLLLSALQVSNPRKHLNNGMMWLRVALGFALIIPMPGAAKSESSGYSLAQTLVMQVVVHGVRLADQVWSSALDYLQSRWVFATLLHQGRLCSKRSMLG